MRIPLASGARSAWSPPRIFASVSDGDTKLSAGLADADAGDAGGEMAAPPSPPEPPTTPLDFVDLDNTKWKVVTTNREEGFLSGPGQDQEFTLLQDGKVVWGGQAGGYGTGGRWTLRDNILEVIRTTPLGLVTGRDYYMTSARAEIDDNLQFQINGIIRSYNALFPVMVVADFVATRQPGRFVMDTDDDEKDETAS